MTDKKELAFYIFDEIEFKVRTLMSFEKVDIMGLNAIDKMIGAIVQLYEIYLKLYNAIPNPVIMSMQILCSDGVPYLNKAYWENVLVSIDVTRQMVKEIE